MQQTHWNSRKDIEDIWISVFQVDNDPTISKRITFKFGQ